MAELHGIQEDVRFNWPAAERLTAELRATADLCEGQIQHRNTIAGQAKREWRGVYAEQFSGRMKTCTGDAKRLAEAMRHAANQLEELGRLARKEQDRRERGREWERHQKHQGLWEDITEFFSGDDDKPPDPDPVEPLRYTSPAPVSGSRG